MPWFLFIHFIENGIWLRVTMLWAEALCKHNLHSLCWEVYFKHCITRVPPIWRFLAIKSLHGKELLLSATVVPPSESMHQPTPELQFQSSYPVWSPIWLRKGWKSFCTTSKQINQLTQNSQWYNSVRSRSSTGLTTGQRARNTFFSIAVHCSVVLGKSLNFPHSHPLVQEG